MKNWEDSLEKMKGQLEKRKWLLPKMLFRGRTLIANLVSSSLLHIMMCIDPPLPYLVRFEEF